MKWRRESDSSSRITSAVSSLPIETGSLLRSQRLAINPTSSSKHRVAIRVIVQFLPPTATGLAAMGSLYYFGRIASQKVTPRKEKAALPQADERLQLRGSATCPRCPLCERPHRIVHRFVPQKCRCRASADRTEPG